MDKEDITKMLEEYLNLQIDYTKIKIETKVNQLCISIDQLNENAAEKISNNEENFLKYTSRRFQ